MDSTRSVLCPVLVGRDDILELADLRLADATSGHGRTLLLAGEAGLGKTRLVGAITRRAQATGAAVADGALAPQDQQVPAASILDLARTMARRAPFTDLGAALLRLRDDAVSAERIGRRLLVSDMVDRICVAITGPTVLVFDDLHWADDLSLEIIGDLARAGRDLPLLVIAAYRTEEAPPGTSLRDWRARLLTQRVAEEARLERLTREQTATVTTLLLATGLPAPRDVVDAVFERTDGVPLHIEELLGAMRPDARVDVAAIRGASIPDTLEDAVLARVGRRSPDAQAVARAGAVIGRCFIADVLAGMMDLPAEALDAPLQELVDHAVLDAPGERGLYDFRHQLLRDVLYRSVPARERRRFHALAGEFGAVLEGASEIHASLHYERAGMPERAFDSAREGARQAAAMSAHREAFALYRRAVDHAPNDLPLDERGLLLVAYAGEAAAVEEIDVVLRVLPEAEGLLRSAGNDLAAIGARLDLINLWRRTGEPISSRAAAISEAIDALESIDAGPQRDVLLADACLLFAIVDIDRFALAGARVALRRARVLAEDLGDRETLAVVDWLDTRLAAVAGDIDGGLRGLEALADEMVRSGIDGVSVYRDGTELAIRYLEYDQAARFAAAGIRHADEVQQSHCAHVMTAGRAMLAWVAGDWERAAAEGEQAIADRGCQRAATMARWAVGYVALGRGDVDHARVVLDEARVFAERSEAVDLLVPALWGLAEAALLAGDRDGAVSHCEAAMASIDGVGQALLLTPFVVTGVRAYHAAGRPDGAIRWMDGCETRLGDGPPMTRPAIAHGRGLVALEAGSTGAARRDLEAALRGWVERGRTWEADWCRLDLATSMVRSNRFAAAVAIASEVRESAARLDSPALLARADALVRQARGHVAVDEPWRPLTAREFEVARLVAEGRTNGEIADSLGIAPKTASSHVEHILAKLGASRRAEIATWASHVERAPAVH